MSDDSVNSTSTDDVGDWIGGATLEGSGDKGQEPGEGDKAVEKLSQQGAKEGTATPADAGKDLTPAASGWQPPATEDEFKARATEYLKGLKPDEVVKLHPGMDGKVGELADRLFRTKTPELQQLWQKQQEAAREEAELARLKETDPLRWAEKMAEREDRRKAQEGQQRLAAQVRDSIIGEAQAVVERFAQSLPAPVLAEVAQKQARYQGQPWHQGFQAWLGDLVESLRAYDRSQWEREARPAIRKEVLAEINGGKPVPELEGGRPIPGARVITDAEVEAMSLEEYDRYFDEKGNPKPGVIYKPGRGGARA